MSRALSAGDQVLAAMAAACELHDVYEPGFKSRPPVYYRELRHPDGRKRAVSSATLNRLSMLDLVVSASNVSDGGYGYDVELKMTSAGRDRAEAVSKFDLDEFMNKKPATPEQKAQSESRRVLRRLADGSVRILNRHWKGYMLVSSKPIYEPIALATFKACLPHLEKYRNPGEAEDSYRLSAEGHAFVATLPAPRKPKEAA